MPKHELPLRPKIRIIFRGFVITRIQEGTEWAELSSLRNSKCHQPQISIIEITADGAEIPVDQNKFIPLADQGLSLTVDGTAESGIRIFQKDTDPFNRLDDENDSRDFRWFIDLKELHGDKKLEVDTSKLKPMIKLNNALFHTFAISPGEVRIKRHQKPSRRFGKFGLELAAHVYLDKAGSKAVLKNGDAEILAVDTEQGSRYEIVFDCNCHTDIQESDFPLVYDVIGGSLAEEEKLDLEGDPLHTGPSCSPEVYCVCGNIP